MVQAAVLVQPVPDLAHLSLSKSQEKVFENAPRQINPSDRIALEAALSLQDENKLQLASLLLGAPEEERLLRETVALGSRRAVLVVDPCLSAADPLIVARLLAAALRRVDASLVFCGPGQVGPRVSEDLGFELCLDVESVLLEGEELTINDARVSLPALLCLSGGYSPRMASPIKIMKAAKTEIGRWDCVALGLDPAGMTPGALIRRTFLPYD